MDSLFTSDFYGNRWANGTITWSVATEGLLVSPTGLGGAAIFRALTKEEITILRQAFDLWDAALESVMFEELPQGDPSALVQIGLGDTNGSSGLWSASWTTVRTAASIILSPDLELSLFAIAAAHEIANVLGLGDIDDGGYVESLTSDPFSSFQLANPNIAYLSRIDHGLINLLYEEDNTDYLGYLASLSKFSQFILGESNTTDGDLLQGTEGDDLIQGHAGDDILSGGEGDDLLFAGDGNDLIIGGDGEDTMHGGFGGNTFSSCIDGCIDQLFIRSDHFLVNPFSDAGESIGQQNTVDLLQGLETTDNIFIEAGHGRTLVVTDAPGGLGLFVDGILEAIYTGGDLSAVELMGMTEVVAA